MSSRNLSETLNSSCPPSPSVSQKMEMDELKISPVGITLGFIEKFIQQCGGASNLRGLHTRDVCTKYIIPMTINHKNSITEKFQFKMPATWYICHSWSYIFLDVIESITITLKNIHTKSYRDKVIWMDLFCLSQHQDTSIYQEYNPTHTTWHEDFSDLIPYLGNFMLILLPWETPISLRRMWCLYELVICTIHKLYLEIAMTDSAWKNFNTTIVKNDQDDYFLMLSKIKSEYAKCTSLDEYNTIYKVLSTNMITKDTFFTMDSMIIQYMTTWLVKNMEKRCLNLSSNEQSRSYWKQLTAQLYAREGRYDIAEHVLLDSLYSNETNLGIDHPSTLSTMNRLATLYIKIGDYDKAKPYFISCLDRQKQATSETHPDTLEYTNNLANLYEKLKEYEKAEALYEECLQTRSTILGPKHKSTLDVMSNLGGLYCILGKYSDAEALFDSVLNTRKEMLGENHADTLTSLNNLASLYICKHDYRKAEKIYDYCVNERTRLLGETHPHTILSMENLAEVYMLLKSPHQAEPLFIQIVEHYKRMFGNNHVITVKAMDRLAMYYGQLSKFSDMETVSWECHETRKYGLVGEKFPVAPVTSQPLHKHKKSENARFEEKMVTDQETSLHNYYSNSENGHINENTRTLTTALSKSNTTTNYSADTIVHHGIDIQDKFRVHELKAMHDSSNKQIDETSSGVCSIM